VVKNESSHCSPNHGLSCRPDSSEGWQDYPSGHDVIFYGSRFGRKFYIDQRTKHNPDPTPDVVHALGRTSNMHWLYVCPDCGMIHSVFQPNIRHVGLVRCKNEASSFRRYFIGPDAKAHLIPAKQVKLITEQFDFN
jgi:hypothetical protein